MRYCSAPAAREAQLWQFERTQWPAVALWHRLSSYEPLRLLLRVALRQLFVNSNVSLRCKRWTRCAVRNVTFSSSVRFSVRSSFRRVTGYRTRLAVGTNFTARFSKSRFQQTQSCHALRFQSNPARSEWSWKPLKTPCALFRTDMRDPKSEGSLQDPSGTSCTNSILPRSWPSHLKCSVRSRTERKVRLASLSGQLCHTVRVLSRKSKTRGEDRLNRQIHFLLASEQGETPLHGRRSFFPVANTSIPRQNGA